jgi:hypothetical protein
LQKGVEALNELLDARRRRLRSADLGGSAAVGGFYAVLLAPVTWWQTALALGNAYGFATGKEIALGRNFRIAPWGNRTGDKGGRFPRYHRRWPAGPNGRPRYGGSIRKHRPWEPPPEGAPWWRIF